MLKPTEQECRDIVRAIFGDDQDNHGTNCKFAAYFKHYFSVVCPASSGDAVIQLETPAIRTHNDVIRCVQIIFNNPKISYNQFVFETVEKESPKATLREKEYVAKLVVEIAFCTNCTLRDYCWDNFIPFNSRTFKWEGDVSLLQFMENTFKTNTHQRPKSEMRLQHRGYKKSLKAWKLVKRYGMKIRPTSNLSEHLILDPKTLTLNVFHQVSFLRAHLMKSKDESLDLNFEESLKR